LEVTGSDKRTRLERCCVDYDRKKFYKIAQSRLGLEQKSVTDFIKKTKTKLFSFLKLINI
jgi:hypothetical protein